MAYLERSELDGGITLKKMKEVAETMHCRFVYAIVPAGGEDESIEMIIEQQAETIARGIVEHASVHMMLEAQQLSKDDNEKEVQHLEKQIIYNMPRNFWED